MLSYLIYRSMRSLVLNLNIPFYKNKMELNSLKSLAFELVHNSSLIFRSFYLVNSLMILLIFLFPNPFSKILYSFFINPKNNPITKATLFYIYHHAY